MIIKFGTQHDNFCKILYISFRKEYHQTKIKFSQLMPRHIYYSIAISKFFIPIFMFSVYLVCYFETSNISNILY